MHPGSIPLGAGSAGPVSSVWSGVRSLGYRPGDGETVPGDRRVSGGVRGSGSGETLRDEGGDLNRLRPLCLDSGASSVSGVVRVGDGGSTTPTTSGGPMRVDDRTGVSLCFLGRRGWGVGTVLHAPTPVRGGTSVARPYGRTCRRESPVEVPPSPRAGRAAVRPLSPSPQTVPFPSGAPRSGSSRTLVTRLEHTHPAPEAVRLGLPFRGSWGTPESSDECRRGLVPETLRYPTPCGASG